MLTVPRATPRANDRPGTTGAPAIRFNGVGRTFRRRSDPVIAVDDVSLVVRQDEFVAIVGPSGCGKSTMLRMAAGLVNPTSGSIDLTLRDPQRTLCSVVFQEYSIFPWRTVLANVRLGLDAQKMSRSRANERALAWIERVGLSGFEDDYPEMLSGGMKQRVALARALVMEPEILLLDEPFAALDAQMRKILQEELLSIYESTANTVVLVTHSLEEAILLSDRIILMTKRPGRIKEEFVVPFDRPRDGSLRSTPAFGELEERIWSKLREEVTGGGGP